MARSKAKKVGTSPEAIAAERAKPAVRVWSPPPPAEPPVRSKPKKVVPAIASKPATKPGWRDTPIPPERIVGASESVRDIPAGLPTLGRHR